MGIQRQLKAALKTSQRILDAEDVKFGTSDSVKAVIEYETRDGGLGYGADEKKRRIKLSFPAGALPHAPKFGSKFTARGKTWQIDKIDPGLVAIQIEGSEPEKRSA